MRELMRRDDNCSRSNDGENRLWKDKKEDEKLSVVEVNTSWRTLYCHEMNIFFFLG